MLRTKTVLIPSAPEGFLRKIDRDAGRTYVVDEMPALVAEQWAARAFMAMNRERLQISNEIAGLGMVGFAMVGFQAFAGGDWFVVKDLMAEMLPYFSIQESENVVRKIGAQGDIWEVTTLYRLRRELIELSAGFTFADAVSILAASAPDKNSQTTSTSPA